MPPRILGYLGLLLLVVAIALLITASRERQYESTVVRLKGKVLAKELRPLGQTTVYAVRYRVTVQNQTLEREGDVQKRKTWDAIRIGDEVDVESIGVTPNETRLSSERVAGSGVYVGIAAAVGVGGFALIGVRLFRREKGDR
jgi:hypothetical protein